MIHSEVLKELNEEELSMLFALTDRFFKGLGLTVKYGWLGMLRHDVTIHYLKGINNIKEEYIGVRDSLINKLQNNGF